MRRLTVALLALCAAGCHHGAGGEAGADAGAGDLATPVKVGRVGKRTLPLWVRAPGHTVALQQEKVRAPFKGRLLRLRVMDGQRVKDGEVVAVVVSMDSEAALTGARAMLRAARSPGEQRDAQRALDLAQEGIVQTPLHAPRDGVVVSHSADEGALVGDGEEILSLAASDSIVFVADVLQTDVPRVQKGAAATVRLAALEGPLEGTVRAVLPSASAKELTVPVRIDLPPSQAPVLVGLYGTCRIQVGEHPEALTVPKEAVLRDDLTGKTRVALVGPDGKAHWEVVQAGLEEAGEVELLAPPLEVGTRVITQGQVGLPDGTPVQVEP